MSRFSKPTDTPAQPTIEGDDSFAGINEKLSRDKLQPGFIHRGRNTRMRHGDVRPRPGTVMPAFANAIVFDEILGAGFYSNPNGPEAILIATPNMVYAIADGTYPMPIAIPPKVVPLDTPCEFVQAFDKVLMFRGTERTPMEWDGISSAGFTLIKAPTNPTKEQIPNAETASVFKFRLLVPTNRDDVAISDILDYTQFDPILENWRINLGSADKLVRIFPWAQNGAIMFKERTILLMANFEDPQHPENAQLQAINDELGLCGRWAAVRAGGDVHFMSRTHPGIYRLTQVLQESVQTAPLPISDPIAPVIDRINWEASANIRAVLLGEYVIWFVPLDGAEVNNAALVWNNATQQWESAPDVWSGDATAGDSASGGVITAWDLQVDQAFVMNYQGHAALYAIDAGTRTVYVLYARGALTDQLVQGEQEIDFLMESRGYATLGWNATSRRDNKRMELGLETWRPNIDITELTESQGDERPLVESLTKSRTRNTRFAIPDYGPSNANDDFFEPGREDYSVELPGDGISLGENGIALGMKQRWIQPLALRARAHWFSYRIRNTQGYCAVTGILQESTGTQRQPRIAA